MNWFQEHKKTILICGALSLAFIAGTLTLGLKTVFPYAILALCPIAHLLMHSHGNKKSCH